MTLNSLQLFLLHKIKNRDVSVFYSLVRNYKKMVTVVIILKEGLG